MTDHRETVRLTAAQETLLITLYSRTAAAAAPILDDPQAQRLMARIEYDFDALKVPHGTVLGVCLRAKKLDETVRQFLAAHPDGTVLHLGCGLDTRFYRVDNGAVDWFDLDLPDVIELRRRLLDETPRYRMIASSAAELDWIDRIPRTGRGVMIVAEGLMMYLSEDEAKALLLKLREAFPDAELIFDAYSTLTARTAGRHPSLRKTGAVLKWGIDDAREIETWAPGIRLIEEWFFTHSPAIRRLSLGDRLIFAVTGLFPIVRRAHRVLYFRLGRDAGAG